MSNIKQRIENLEKEFRHEPKGRLELVIGDLVIKETDRPDVIEINGDKFSKDFLNMFRDLKKNGPNMNVYIYRNEDDVITFENVNQSN